MEADKIKYRNDGEKLRTLEKRLAADKKQSTMKPSSPIVSREKTTIYDTAVAMETTNKTTGT